MATETLVIRIEKKYFDQIRNGTKTEEYREYTDYWKSRIEKNENLSKIQIILGYPKEGKTEGKILEFPYKGYEIKEIQHEIFENKLTKVFAIKLEKK